MVETEEEYKARIKGIADEIRFRTAIMNRLVPLLMRKPERMQLFLWLIDEMEYADGKFDKDEQREAHDESIRTGGLNAFWLRQITQYHDRANVFIDNHEAGAALPNRGQQAIGKAWMTTMGCMESLIRVFGKLPKPGVPSGEIHEWE